MQAPLPPPRVSTRPQSAPHPVAAMGSKPVSNLPPLDTRHTTVAVNLPKDLILIDPVSVAQHLVAIDREIYVTITPQGLLAAAKSSGRWRASEEEAALDAPAGSPPVSGVIALNERFNVVVGLVTTAVIGCDTPSARAEMMVHWIRVANCCLEYLNLNAANAITASLSSASLFRLTKSWEKVPKSAKSLLQSLQHLFSPSANFRVLRSLLANIASTKRSRSKSPLQQYCVPWLGMHLREIIQLSEIHPVIGIPAGVDGQKPQSDLQTQQQLEPMINFDRCWWISTVIDQALQFQWPAGCVHLDRVPNSWSHWGVVLDALPTGSPSKVEVHDGGGSDASAPDVSDPSALDGLLSPPRFPWAQIPTVHKVLRDGGSDLLRTPSQQFQASLALEPRVASGPNGPNGVGVGGGGTGLVSPAGAGDAFQQGQGGAGSGGGSRFRTSSGGAPGGGGLLLSGIVSGGAQVRSLMSAVSPSSASGAGGPGPLTLLPPVPSAGILGGNGRKPERGWLQLKRS
ncbi:ras guanine nucleotide exchange factor domain-containing protein [Zopfochytrium polystomum]|nr:ras guanine nucleotide exchange factor domain-containing protein [Zopfochytrium polystomum]